MASARIRRSLASSGIATVATLLLAGVGGAPANAYVTGDRSERCTRALSMADDIRRVTAQFPENWSSRDRRTTYQLLNVWLAPNARQLQAVVAAPQNRAKLSEIARISRELGSNQNVTRDNVDRIAKLGRQLEQNIRDQREFTITLTDEQGQPQTKTTAC